MADDPESGGRANRVQSICSHRLSKQWKRPCAAVTRGGRWLHCLCLLERSPEPDRPSWTRGRNGYKARKPRRGAWSGNVYSRVMTDFGNFLIGGAQRSAASPQPISDAADFSMRSAASPQPISNVRFSSHRAQGQRTRVTRSESSKRSWSTA